MATAKKSNNQFVVFAGGYDGEMVEIINVCRETGVEVIDKHLAWGPSVDAYKAEIKEALADGKTPVCIELAGAEAIAGAVVIDHHNENAGKPASILQILDLLGMEPTRRQQLIAANDTGYIPGMLAMGASAEEVAEVRLLDRSAQGITPEQEAEAERAIAAAETVNGVTIVRMAHSKTATVCDRLWRAGVPQKLLILSEDGESDFFGDWELCEELYEAFPAPSDAPWSNWKGGRAVQACHECGFWGHSCADQAAVEAYVLNWFGKVQFVNCTPHAIKLNDGRVFEPSGSIARVAQSISDFDKDGIATQSFGKVEGLPEPKAGTIYIVSAMVLSRAQAEGRKDVVAPATGHKDCVRDEGGRIKSVPGFLR